MAQYYHDKDYLVMFADYGNPKEHKHLASHLIISMEDEMHWMIEGKKVVSNGIVIGPDISHVAITTKQKTEKILVFYFLLFAGISLKSRQCICRERNIR